MTKLILKKCDSTAYIPIYSCGHSGEYQCTELLFSFINTFKEILYLGCITLFFFSPRNMLFFFADNYIRIEETEMEKKWILILFNVI